MVSATAQMRCPVHVGWTVIGTLQNSYAGGCLCDVLVGAGPPTCRRLVKTSSARSWGHRYRTQRQRRRRGWSSGQQHQGIAGRHSRMGRAEVVPMGRSLRGTTTGVIRYFQAQLVDCHRRHPVHLHPPREVSCAVSDDPLQRHDRVRRSRCRVGAARPASTVARSGRLDSGCWSGRGGHPTGGRGYGCRPGRGPGPALRHRSRGPARPGYCFSPTASAPASRPGHDCCRTSPTTGWSCSTTPAPGAPAWATSTTTATPA